MKIVDLNAKLIEVENLDLAFQQADTYRHYRHIDPAFAQLDKELQSYWEDVYQKLLKFKTEQP